MRKKLIKSKLVCAIFCVPCVFFWWPGLVLRSSVFITFIITNTTWTQISISPSKICNFFFFNRPYDEAIFALCNIYPSCITERYQIWLTSILKLFQFGNQTLSNSTKLNRTIQFDKFGNRIQPNQNICVRVQLHLIPNSISIEVTQIF